MASISPLPGVSSIIEDFGLQVSAEPTILNDSILIIGTAADGPMYEPIPVLNKEKIVEVFGSFGQGTLVRGVYEALDATLEGTPDVRAMRIGNGIKASLAVVERLSTARVWDQKTSGQTSLTLTALYPGSVYNGVAVFQDEEKKINIYNPKTGNFIKFTYDDTNPFNSTVDARNVRELVDAINADAEASTIVVASTSPIDTEYEVSVNAGTSGVTVTAGKATISLKSMLENFGDASGPVIGAGSGYIVEPDTSKTAGNLIDTIDEIYSLSISEPTRLATKGVTTVTTTLSPYDGKADSRFDTIHALEDYATKDNIFYHDPSGTVVSEYVNYLDRAVLDDVTIATSGVNFTAITKLNVVGLFNAPDDSRAVTASGSVYTVTDSNGNTGTTALASSGTLAMAAARASSGTLVPLGYVSSNIGTVDAGITEYINITTSGFAEYLTDPGQVIIEVSDTGGTSDSEWTSLFYHPVSGIYISDFSVASGTGVITLSIGTNASGYATAGGDGNLVSAGLLKSGAAPASGAYVLPEKHLRVSCYTVKGFINEVNSLPNLAANTTDWTSYFFRGRELIFSDTVPTDIIVNHGVKVDYEPGADVIVSDSHDGEVKFVGSVQPGPSGGAIHASLNSIIGFKYSHLPQFPAISTTALSLDAGTDGTKMNNDKLYDEYTTAYETLENYNVQIVVPMGANIDSSKAGYNTITGLPETVNSQFQVQLDAYLDAVSTNVNETIGMMGVEPATTSSIADVNTWVKRLTVQDLSDPNRAANIMPLLGSRYINVVAFEPVFDNLGGLPYTANGQAAYAGMVSSLMPHHSPTNKSMPNARRTRFDLSNTQLAALSGMRLVSMRKKPNRNPVITEAITAAPTGSDFKNLSTVRITFSAMDVVREVCDPFIGQPNTQAKRNAMEAAITKGLQGMVEVGALRKFAFTIASSPSQQVLGLIDIDLVLVPVFEIKKIRTTVRLRTEIPQG